ncbi:WD40 repeat protein [Moumouvirus australiensis]|uniref:WD40 repeat protein n=1 Tax=Moumouvirus australiensis TaxID=2109587 RepID=A0A2P1EN06_9VIRU|nr:WD40 repeat protein [Moumouvirus australiensis]YP_010790210.1 WD40 repeat protein [Moumouvirus australiensis]AVL94412.1 WD40 repeat protein [Moumouvirus australiensis]AVL95277.1 WD40 repeat protein [Moumouvirus australiensis]
MELFSDIVLRVVDKNRTIVLPCHKIILYFACDYFKKLFSTFKEKDFKEIEIIVPNAFVSCNIIKGFYKEYLNESLQKYSIDGAQLLEEWQYTIEEYKCRDFFMLDTDKNKLYDLLVPPSYFDELVNFVDSIGYDKKTVKLLLNNLPTDYDLSGFPMDLINKMYNLSINYDVISLCKSSNNNYYVQKHDVETKQLKEEIQIKPNMTVHSNEHLCFTPDHSKIIMATNKTIIVFNGNGIEINSFDSQNQIKNLYATNNNIITCSKNSISIFDINTGELINNLEINFGFCYFCSPVYNEFICGCNNGDIIIIDLESGFIKNIFNHNGKKIKSITMLSENKYLTIAGKNISNHCVKIWENNICAKSFNLMLNTHMDFDNSDEIFILHHSNYLLVNFYEKCVVYDMESFKEINTHESNNTLGPVKYLSNNLFLELNSNGYDYFNELHIYNFKTNKSTILFDINGKIFDYYGLKNIENELSKKLLQFI